MSRKRTANTGRMETSIVAYSLDSRQSPEGVVFKASASDATIDGALGLGLVAPRSEHRNRIGIDDTLTLTATDCSTVRDVLKFASRVLEKRGVRFAETVESLGNADIRTVRVSHGGKTMLDFIQHSKAAALFECHHVRMTPWSGRSSGDGDEKVKSSSGGTKPMPYAKSDMKLVVIRKTEDGILTSR